MELNDNKAGMQGLDKERINAVIRENTGAQYQKHQEKRDQRIQQRIEQNRTRLRELSQEQIDRADKEMDVIAGQLEERRDLSRTIVHVDMDAFYAAVEMRDEPKLRQVPMAVGGDSMLVEAVLAEYDADYTMGSLDEAYLDITDFLAARRSRGLENYRHERKQYSNACKCRLPRLTDMSGVVVARIDEVCQRCRQMQTTVTDTVSFGSSAEDVVAEMRHRIEQTTGLTASAAFGGTVSPQATLAKFFAHQDYHNSVSQTMSNTSGIAPNGMLAKICSDMNKPNGQFVLSPDLQAVKDFVMMLPIRKVGGIGSVTDALLKALDIDTCGDLWSNRGILSLLFSELSASYFLRISMGIGSSFMSTQDSDRKSMSVERTFRPTSDAEELLGTCKKLCDSLANDADEHELAGKTVTLKIKQSTFDVRTRASTGVHCLSSAEELYIVASKLLKKEIEEACGLLELRLMGVRLSALSPRSSQQILTITKFFSKSPVKNTSVCRDAEVEVIECAASSSTALGSSTDVGQLTADVVDVVDESDGGECENRAVEEDDEATSPPSPLDITCPVCSRRLLKCSTLAEANAHVDDCLSKKEILHVLRKSRTVEKRRAPKMENVSQKGFTAGCLSSNAPSPAAVGTGTDAKRAKPASQGATTPTRPNNTRPLEFYFNKPS